MKDWKRILEVLKQLEEDKRFYRDSLNAVSENMTEENYQVFLADCDVMHKHERELYRLSREE
jgi:DNA-binding LacI/PurR family transcriptional regulator